jgi:hypothetical protein
MFKFCCGTSSFEIYLGKGNVTKQLSFSKENKYLKEL